MPVHFVLIIRICIYGNKVRVRFCQTDTEQKLLGFRLFIFPFNIYLGWFFFSNKNLRHKLNKCFRVTYKHWHDWCVTFPCRPCRSILFGHLGRFTHTHTHSFINENQYKCLPGQIYGI